MAERRCPLPPLVLSLVLAKVPMLVLLSTTFTLSMLSCAWQVSRTAVSGQVFFLLNRGGRDQLHRGLDFPHIFRLALPDLHCQLAPGPFTLPFIVLTFQPNLPGSGSLPVDRVAGWAHP